VQDGGAAAPAAQGQQQQAQQQQPPQEQQQQGGEDDEDCVDDDEACAAWAQGDGCLAQGPAFMLDRCRRACGVCGRPYQRAVPHNVRMARPYSSIARCQCTWCLARSHVGRCEVPQGAQ
jgi:hypothetical protein